MRSFVAVFIAVAVFSTSVQGEDVRAGIRNSKEKHDASVRAARHALEGAMLNAIKAAANAEQFAELQAILDARIAFLRAQELPKVPSLEDAVGTYITARKVSAENVYKEYRKAIQTLAKDLLLEIATPLREEMIRFENSERLAIGLPTIKEDASEKKRLSSSNEENTQVFIERLVTRLLEELEQVSKLETTALQYSEHDKLIGTLNKELRRKRLTFRFPIENVTPAEARTYSLDFAASLELKDVRYVSRLAARSNLRMRESEALSIGSDHVYRIRGVGKIVPYGHRSGSEEPPRIARGIHIFSVDSLYNSKRYGIYVLNHKTDIRKVGE